MSLIQLYDVHGKTTLITDASGGLGEQFTRCLQAQGTRVILASRSDDKLKVLRDELGNAKKVETEKQPKEFINLIPLGFVASPQDFDTARIFLAHNEH